MSDELRKLAQSATPGPWHVYSQTCRAGDVRGGQYVHGADPYEDVVAAEATMLDSAFIAAANPAAVVALLDERDSLATQLEQMRRDLATMTALYERACTAQQTAERERDEWKRAYSGACDLLDKAYADLTAQNAKLARIRNVSAPAPVRDAVLRIIDEKEGGQ